MKGLLTLWVGLGTLGVACGQGYIAFYNTGTTRVFTNGLATLAPAGGPVGTWYYALLWAPTTQTTVDASLAGWTFGAMATNTAYAGRFNGCNTADGSGAAVAGLAPDSAANFVIVGWSGDNIVWSAPGNRVGANWEAVFAGRPLTTVRGAGTIGMPGGWIGWYGISPVAIGPTGTGIALAPSGGPYSIIFGNGPGFIGSWSMNYYYWPEPSVITLAGLGAAALLVFRRRK